MTGSPRRLHRCHLSFSWSFTGQLLPLVQAEVCRISNESSTICNIDPVNRGEKPIGSFFWGQVIENDIEVDSDGNVHASNKPGLGADIDIELIERNRFAIVF